METITSKSNPLCVHLRKLASSRSYREETGEFLCDSPKLLQEAALWGAPITALLYTQGAALPPGLEGRVPRMAEVSESVMRSVSPMETPQGAVFSCRSPGCAPPERLGPGAGGRLRFLVLDGVQDPGNVGTILRTADAFGARVIVLPGCADLHNPKTLRAGMGVHFRTEIYRCTLEELTALLKEAGCGRTRRMCGRWISAAVPWPWAARAGASRRRCWRPVTRPSASPWTPGASP